MTRSLRASAAPTAPAHTPASPVAAVRPDPEVWAIALRHAAGDTRRCIPSADGRTVLVVNHPVR